MEEEDDEDGDGEYGDEGSDGMAMSATVTQSAAGTKGRKTSFV